MHYYLPYLQMVDAGAYCTNLGALACLRHPPKQYQTVVLVVASSMVPALCSIQAFSACLRPGEGCPGLC